MSAIAAPLALVALSTGRLVGADAVFYGVFGVFVVAFAVLCVLTVRWALRRDRARRPEWLRRQQERGRYGVVPPPSGGERDSGTPPPRTPPPRTNGHAPRRPDQRGPRRTQPG